MAGKADAYKIHSYPDFADEKVAANDLVVEAGDFVKLSNNFIEKAGVGDRIEGVSHTTKTFTSDNETVAKANVNYRPRRDLDTYKVIVDGGVLDQSYVGQFFEMTVDQAIDFTSADPSNGVFRLEAFTEGGLYGIVTITTQGA